jgi:hypothetical protein
MKPLQPLQLQLLKPLLLWLPILQLLKSLTAAAEVIDRSY